MGNSFSNAQIRNPQHLDRDEFLAFFTERMQNAGYVPGDADDYALAYCLSFSENSEWTAVSAENWNQNDILVRFGVSRLAEILGTSCLYIMVSDSDFAMLELYDGSGAIVNSAAVGRPEIEMPAPDPEKWKPYLHDGHTFDELEAVQNGDYIFVEDALTELAPVFGMNGEQILFDAEDADAQAVWLYFKKEAEPAAKIITVNAAFKQIFGEALEPLGFIKAKTKMPYFMRAVNDEIIHVIGLHSHGTGLCVVSGAATVYRKEILFNSKQRYDSVWLHPIFEFYKYTNGYNTDYDLRSKLFWYGFRQKDTEDMLRAMREALADTQKWVLPVLDAIRTKDDMTAYLLSMGGYVYPSLPGGKDPEGGYPCSDGGLMLTLDDPYSFAEREKALGLKRALYELEHHVNDRTEEQYQDVCSRISIRYEKNMALLSRMLDEPENREKVMAEMQQRKSRNTETLRSYGLDI